MDVEQDKEWTVTFNIKMDPRSLTDTSIFVYEGTDENNRHPIKVQSADDQESVVVVQPMSFYQHGQTYTLVIHSDVQSMAGDHCLHLMR